MRQTTPATPGQPTKALLPIPVEFGLLDVDGAVQDFRMPGAAASVRAATVVLDRAEMRVRLDGVARLPVLSALRGFSAPVILTTDAPSRDAYVLLSADPDLFNRWEAGQMLARQLILARVRGQPDEVNEARFAEALRRALQDEAADNAFKALLLELPSEGDLGSALAPDADPALIHAAREALRARIAVHLSDLLTGLHGALQSGDDFSPDAESAGRRALRNAALDMLVADPCATNMIRASGHFDAAANMTDAMGGLSALSRIGGAGFDTALSSFYARWKSEPLVVDKWFAVQARALGEETAGRVLGLTAHPAFDSHTPNRLRALVAGFSVANPFRFHDPNGAGYRFLADQILSTDAFNPTLAARLMGPLGDHARYRTTLAKQMKAQLERIVAHPGLSKNVAELAAKALEA